MRSKKAISRTFFGYNGNKSNSLLNSKHKHMRLKTMLFIQEIQGFNVVLPAGVDYINPGLFAVLLSAKYPRLSFDQIYERKGSNVVMDEKDGLLTIKSVTP